MSDDNLDLLEKILYFIRDNDKSVIVCFDEENTNLFLGADCNLDKFFRGLFTSCKKKHEYVYGPG